MFPPKSMVMIPAMGRAIQQQKVGKWGERRVAKNQHSCIKKNGQGGTLTRNPPLPHLVQDTKSDLKGGSLANKWEIGTTTRQKGQGEGVHKKTYRSQLKKKRKEPKGPLQPETPRKKKVTRIWELVRGPIGDTPNEKEMRTEGEGPNRAEAPVIKKNGNKESHGKVALRVFKNCKKGKVCKRDKNTLHSRVGMWARNGVLGGVHKTNLGGEGGKEKKSQGKKQHYHFWRMGGLRGS